MSLRWRFVEACTPLFGILPPWWRVRVYGRLAGNPFTHGGFGGRKVIRRIAPHGFSMELSLDDWMERKAALTGIFYAIEATEALRWLLRSGDAFVDVGANIGFMTLTAEHFVGGSGKIISFEPNVELYRRLSESIDRNRIQNAELHQCALGESEGQANLAVHDHHGASSLRHGGVDGMTVRVVRGDEIVSGIDASGWCVVKIDVEGYEQRVLSGMTGLLRRPRTAFLVEITDRWLTPLGGSADSLFATMKEAGYTPFQPILSRKKGFVMKKLDGHLSSVDQYDAIFLRDSDDWQGRQ